MGNLSLYSLVLYSKKSRKNALFSETSLLLRLIGGVSSQRSVVESLGAPDRLKITDTGSSWTYNRLDKDIKVFFNSEGILSSYRTITNQLNNTGEK
jgi:hypothetical protein